MRMVENIVSPLMFHLNIDVSTSYIIYKSKNKEKNCICGGITELLFYPRMLSCFRKLCDSEPLLQESYRCSRFFHC